MRVDGTMTRCFDIDCLCRESCRRWTERERNAGASPFVSSMRADGGPCRYKIETYPRGIDPFSASEASS